nr:MAG TPA: hypothetical protein [Caudoviricetes sp.]
MMKRTLTDMGWTLAGLALLTVYLHVLVVIGS